MKKPIIYTIKDNRGSLFGFEDYISGNNALKNVLLDYPVVYIHNWINNEEYEVYVGETNDIIRRTLQHYEDETGWKTNINNDKAKLIVIGHEHFNKSMTMDVENRLILYLSNCSNIKKVYNSRGNPQNQYYPSREFDTIFNDIWHKLEKIDGDVFESEDKIKDSAFFKASPLHKLTPEQYLGKNMILKCIIDSLETNDRQLIFVEGDAGTGKTVLNSSTFYELYRKYEEELENSKNKNSKVPQCYLLVNHDEQLVVYQKIFKKLDIEGKYGKVVDKPTGFINRVSPENPVDVVFVDEGHLLLTQGKMGYTGENQLADIIKRAKVVVVMFDSNQVLRTENYWESDIIDNYRNNAIASRKYIRLENQLRIKAPKKVIEWIDNFTKKNIIGTLNFDTKDYEIKVFNSPQELERAIKEKAQNEKYRLSRIIATYDWKYNQKNKNTDSKYWQVEIGDWCMPWNRELARFYSPNQKKEIKDLVWAEQPQTINEVGSTYTVQGFDLNYAGIILGPSVQFKDGHIVHVPEESCNDKAIQYRTLSDGTKHRFAEELLEHEVRVLMTRGVNGLYIYACDKNLRDELKRTVNSHFIE